MKILLVTENRFDGNYDREVGRMRLALSYDFPKITGTQITESRDECSDKLLNSCTHIAYMDGCDDRREFEDLGLERIILSNGMRRLVDFEC